MGSSVRQFTTRFVVTLVGSICMLALALAGCTTDPSSSDGPRPLTTEEAEHLALTRFKNFDAGVRSASFTVTDQGLTYEVNSWIDFPAKLGYGSLQVSDKSEMLTLAWSEIGIATTTRTGDAPDRAPLPPPTDGWTSSDLVPSQSRMHALLAILLTLGSDRPDNPVLLAQTDARWIREDSLADTPVTVFAGPSSDTVDTGAETAAKIHYWIDADANLLRLEVLLGGSGEFTVVNLKDAPGVNFAEALKKSG